jgi:hypothetical protein
MSAQEQHLALPHDLSSLYVVGMGWVKGM